MIRTAAASRRQRRPTSRSTVAGPTEIPWRDRPHLQLQTAAEIAGVSEASLYRFASEGLLTFVRLAGRTLVETPSLLAFIARAEPWTPSERGAAARAKRAAIARSSLRR